MILTKLFGLTHFKIERWNRTKKVFGSGWEESFHLHFLYWCWWSVDFVLLSATIKSPYSFVCLLFPWPTPVWQPRLSHFLLILILSWDEGHVVQILIRAPPQPDLDTPAAGLLCFGAVKIFSPESQAETVWEGRCCKVTVGSEDVWQVYVDETGLDIWMIIRWIFFNQWRCIWISPCIYGLIE